MQNFTKIKNCCWILDEKNLDQKKLYFELSNIILNKKEFKSKKKSLNKLNKNINWNKQNKLIMKELNENKISVIIPFYDDLKLLKRAINSVQSQSFKDYELIIIHDNPDDKESIELFKEFVKKKN